ncbi:hypothetical protein SprV_0702450500 [Sparganum proliferum]
MTIPVKVGQILNNEVEIQHMSRLYTTDGSVSDGLRAVIRGATSAGVVPTTCDLQKAVSIGHIRLADESNATVFGYIRINGRTINDNTVSSGSTKVQIGDLGVSSGLEFEKTKRFNLPFIAQATVPVDCFRTETVYTKVLFVGPMPGRAVSLRFNDKHQRRQDVVLQPVFSASPLQKQISALLAVVPVIFTFSI